jgi:hypothetical protein
MQQFSWLRVFILAAAGMLSAIATAYIFNVNDIILYISLNSLALLAYITELHRCIESKDD